MSEIQDDDYFFCANPDCVVVYYFGFRKSVIHKQQLKIRVGIKEKTAPRTLCYCFGYTAEDVHREIRETKQSTIERDISIKINAALCHCEDANPEGRCCLGNVANTVREAFRFYAANKEAEKPELSTAKDCCKVE